MKKIIAILMVLALACSICSCGFRRWPFFTTQTTKEIVSPSEGLELELSEDQTSYIVMGIGTCTDTDIVIPNIYNGLPVTSIAMCAFAQCTSITSVIIPDSITYIGGGAFSFCYSIESIMIGNSVTKINVDTFQGCNSLTNINIPKSVKEIDAFAFFVCTSLISINYDGTMEEWNSVKKSSLWNDRGHITEVVCSNGTITIK